MKFILGKKVNMTQVFMEDGHVEPVTVISAGPNTVTCVKSKESDGYESVQVGYVARPKNETEKAAHKRYQFVHEFRIDNLSASAEKTDESFGSKGGPASGWKVGDTINVSNFAVNDTVEVSGISKGKGFQGVVKRHGFGGGRRTHGQKHSEREPGAIGGRGRAGGRVSLGMRMAGRMGADRITVKNLKVIQVDPEGKLLLVSGAIPGHRGTLVEIRGN